MDYESVTPIHPVAPWIGGKRNLAKTIIPRIDADDHETYAEPFVGMGGVFLRRTRRPRSEVINDYSRDVANLFRITQRHYPQFLDALKFQITTRAEFERLIRTDPTTLTDIERAARFLYLQRVAFGGKVAGQTFGVAPDRPGRFDVSKVGPLLEDLHSRLAGVVIECLDFEEFISRYDRPGTFFYIDPPYWGTEDFYGADMFSKGDFERLASVLLGLKGRFLLSLNDCDEVRKCFEEFTIEETVTAYTTGTNRAGRQPAKEVLITPR